MCNNIEQKLDEVAKEIHWYISYGMLSMYHMMMNVINSEVESEDRLAKIETLERLLNLSESLYENLADEQKQLYHTLAEKMIGIVEK